MKLLDDTNRSSERLNKDRGFIHNTIRDPMKVGDRELKML